MSSHWHLRRAAAVLRAGGVVGYPTEAVFGLGCDPFDAKAVQRIVRLKGRAGDKGLVIIGAVQEHLAGFIAPLTAEQEQALWASWPGHITWVVPAGDSTPDWLTGGRPTVALRMTAHPLAAELCRAFGGALVSTSLNRSGCPPAKTALQAGLRLGSGCDYLLHGPVGPYKQPSTIKDALSGAVLRRGEYPA